ncbi:hypothetical protein XENOCAPTIV_005415 [Xenoophorus captivus]|uniref:Uncharacterized protein n=1 Tax=Xenoophorus captivus TaxID=1517983 RepID=A0ABV0RFP3_9TELE
MFHIYVASLVASYIRTPTGVHSLAGLLMDLQPHADGPDILTADALYQLGRVEEAYRLLLSAGTPNPRAPLLARLALLQLHRGFLYDTNQVQWFELATCFFRKANPIFTHDDLQWSP